ncbi:MAG: thrombospondin type 3 repeat-containing protein [Phycisphaerales bacterium]|nr:thrombospondin type 3 repeat-containing protein [Phycisphaerales bacterium]
MNKQTSVLLLITGCSCCLFVLAAQADPAVIVYENDFETVGDPLLEWTHSDTDVTPLGNRRFLGQFLDDTVTLTLTSLPVHDEVTVSVDLFVIRSWDGNDPGVGGSPDIWKLTNCETSLFQTTFSNVNNHAPEKTQAYPDQFPGGDNPPTTGASEVDTLGYMFPGQLGDSVYHLTFTFPHSNDSLILDFSSILDGPDLLNESWGLDNVQVVVSCSIDSDNDGVPDLTDVCPNNSEGLSVDSEGRPRLDLNSDCVVNGLDLQLIVDELLNQS